MHASPHDVGFCKFESNKADRQLRLAVVNQTKSAFCLVTLEPEFFHKYRLVGTRYEEPKDIRCQLLVKVSFLIVSY